MTQMQSMMHVIHSELHFCYANFSYAVQGHLSDVSLASPGHFLELMSALKKQKRSKSEQSYSSEWHLNNRAKAEASAMETGCSYPHLWYLCGPCSLDNFGPAFRDVLWFKHPMFWRQVELASCSASCRSPFVEVCTPRVGKSSPRNELLSAPIGRRNSSKWTGTLNRYEQIWFHSPKAWNFWTWMSNDVKWCKSQVDFSRPHEWTQETLILSCNAQVCSGWTRNTAPQKSRSRLSDRSCF